MGSLFYIFIISDSGPSSYRAMISDHINICWKT
jgi:hypothetical protein